MIPKDQSVCHGSEIMGGARVDRIAAVGETVAVIAFDTDLCRDRPRCGVKANGIEPRTGQTPYQRLARMPRTTRDETLHRSLLLRSASVLRKLGTRATKPFDNRMAPFRQLTKFLVAIP